MHIRVDHASRAPVCRRTMAYIGPHSKAFHVVIRHHLYCSRRIASTTLATWQLSSTRLCTHCSIASSWACIAGAGESQVPHRPGVPDQELWLLQGQVSALRAVVQQVEALQQSVKDTPQTGYCMCRFQAGLRRVQAPTHEF